MSDYVGWQILAVVSTIGFWTVSFWAGHLHRKVKALSGKGKINRATHNGSKAESAQEPFTLDSRPGNSHHPTNHGEPSQRIRTH